MNETYYKFLHNEVFRGLFTKLYQIYIKYSWNYQKDMQLENRQLLTQYCGHYA